MIKNNKIITQEQQINSFSEQNRRNNYRRYRSSFIYSIFKTQDIKIDRGVNFSVLINVLYHLPIVFSFYIWLDQFQTQYSSSNKILSTFKTNLIYLTNLFVSLSFIIALYIILALVYLQYSSKQLNTLNNPKKVKILQSLPLFVSLHFVCSTILSSILLQVGILSMLLSLVFIFIIALYFQNYIQRKQLTYLYSFQLNIKQKIIIICFVILPLISKYLQNQALFIAFIDTLAIIYTIWFIFEGYKISNTYQILIQKMFIISTSIFIAFFITEHKIMNFVITSNQITTQYILIFIFSFIFFILTFRNKKISSLKNLQKINDKTIKQLDLKFTLQVQKNNMSDIMAYINGVVTFHKYQICQNIDCYLNKKQLYDPLSKQTKINDKKTRGINESCLKFYCKCLYQNLLLLFPSNNELKLNYCQFLLNQFQDSYKIMKILNNIQEDNLGLGLKMKLFQIRRIIQCNHIFFVQNVYSSTLNFQQIIEKQQIYQQILQKINQYILRYLEIWRYTKLSDIQVLKIKQEIEQNQKIIQKLDQKWDLIFQFVQSHMIWKAAYIHYNYFLKHIKLKNRDINEISSMSFKDIVNDYTFNEQFKQNKINKLTKKHMLDNKSCIFTAYLKQDNLIFGRASQNFHNMTKYRISELFHTNIQILLQQEQKKNHKQKLQVWLKEVKYMNQQLYKSKITKIIKKDKKQMKVMKFFKLMINLSENQLEYICFLKNIQDQNNQQVNQTTQSIKQNNQQYQFIHTKQKSLKSLVNIFLKQQNFIPKSQISQLKQSKNVVRLFGFFTIIFVIAVFKLTSNDTSILVNYAAEYIIFIINYRVPFNVGTKFFQYTTGLQNRSNIIANVQKTIGNFQKDSVNPLIRLTIFDQALNNRNTFGPTYADKNIQNITFDQTQVYFTIVSQLTTLQYLNFTADDPMYVMFRNYLEADFDNFFNATRFNFHYKFVQMFDAITLKQNIQVIIQSVLISATIILVIYITNKFFGRIREIMQTILQFEQSQTNEAVQYWSNLHKLYIRYQLIQFKRIQSVKQSQLQNKKDNHSRLSLNRRTKKFKIDQENRKYKIITIIILIGYLASLYLMVIGSSISLANSVSQIKTFQQDGFSMLKYFPQFPIITYATLQKYFSTKFPSDPIWNPLKYKNNYQADFAYGNIPYTGQIKDLTSDFYYKYKYFYFKNICQDQKGIAILNTNNITINQCKSIFDKTFQQGMTAVIRRQYEKSFGYVYQNKDFSVDEIKQLITTTSIFGLFTTDVINTWNSEFNTKVQQFNTSYLNLSLVQIFFIIFIHLFIFQIGISKFLYKNYHTYKVIFDKMVPQKLLEKDKVVRQKFIFQNILQKI